MYPCPIFPVPVGLAHNGLCCPRQGCAVGKPQETRFPPGWAPGSRSQQSLPLFRPQFPQLPNEGSKKNSNCLCQRQKHTRINASVPKLLNPILRLSPVPEKKPQSGGLHCDPPHRRLVLKSELPETLSWGLSWTLFSSHMGFPQIHTPKPSPPCLFMLCCS